MSLVPSHIDLPAKAREVLVQLLNQKLANLTDLYTQTKQAHWNVKGPHFFPLHELFDKLAESLLEAVDDVAERVTALGGSAQGTARMAAKASRLAEFPTGPLHGTDAVKLLVERYAMVAKNARAAIDLADEQGDAATADLFTGLSRDLDKHLWFLEAHLFN